MLAEAIEHQDFQELVDPRLEKNYMDHEMFRMIEAAAACVRHSAAKRPRMSQVNMLSNMEVSLLSRLAYTWISLIFFS